MSGIAWAVAAGGSAGGALAVAGAGRRRSHRRLRLAVGAPLTSPGGAGADLPAGARRRAWWVVPPAAVLALTIGPVALVAVAGGVAALLAVRHRRRSAPGVGAADAALFADLFAAYLAGGATPAVAVAHAGRSVPSVDRAAEAVASALRSGVPPAVAWGPLADLPVLAGVARAAARSTASGSGCADEIRRIARRLRQQRDRDLEQRAARAGIWLVLPLGACFLPAFVLLTVVPVVAGLLPALR